MEHLFEWIKQNQRYEPLSDKRDLPSLQREQARLNDKSQQILEKSQEIDSLLRQINKFEFISTSFSLTHFSLQFQTTQ